MYKRKGLPELGDLVVCTIKRTESSSAFVDLDEYADKEAMIHVSEMPRRWVRNMKTYLKINRKLVCKVMDVNQHNHHVNLSVRRVSDSQSRNKLASWADETKANDILEVFAKKNKLKIDKLYTDVWDKILEKYDSVFPFFQEIASSGEKLLLDVGVDKKLAKQLTELIQKRIQIPKVIIEKDLILISSASDGLEIIKKAIKKAEDVAKKNDVELDIKYFGAPRYSFKLVSEDSKQATAALEKIEKELDDFMKKNQGSAELKKPTKKKN